MSAVAQSSVRSSLSLSANQTGCCPGDDRSDVPDRELGLAQADDFGLEHAEIGKVLIRLAATS